MLVELVSYFVSRANFHTFTFIRLFLISSTFPVLIIVSFSSFFFELLRSIYILCCRCAQM